MPPKQQNISVLLPEPVYEHLNVAGLRSQLQQRDLPVSGSRADLINRLSEDDAASKPARSPLPRSNVAHDEEQGPGASGNQADLGSHLAGRDNSGSKLEDDGSDSSDCSSNPDVSVTIITFDDRGCDPATLIGLRIQGYEHDPEALKLFCGEDTIVITFGYLQTSAYSCIEVDQVLIDGLDQEGDLLIEDAALGIRTTYSEKYRVVGIKCEGMKRMGFVYNEDKTLRVDGYPAHRLGWTHRYRDVALQEWSTGREQYSD